MSNIHIGWSFLPLNVSSGASHEGPRLSDGFLQQLQGAGILRGLGWYITVAGNSIQSGCARRLASFCADTCGSS